MCRRSRWKTCLAAGVLVAFSVAGLGCGGGGGGGEAPKTDTVGVYMKSLPTWAEYSPTQADLDPYVAATPGQTFVPDATPGYVCQTTRYGIQRTPLELVMYSPNVEILWPGAMIQGRSYKEGSGVTDLLGLPIAERTPIKVSIPALKTSDNFREVVPDLATVNQAIGAMVGAATSSNLVAPSTLSYSMQSYHSEEQLALEVGVSGRYMGFSGKASFNYDQTADRTTVVVHFIEKMFEVVVAPPQTPRSFFSSSFTQAKLDEQVAQDKIGPDNLPVYVSNVVYGRMFTFALTSSQSEEKIRAALQAAYDFGVGNVETEAGFEQRQLIQQSEIALATLGGDPEDALSVIRSGSWRAYFTGRPPLSSATPLSYTFRTVTDGNIALVTETASYDRTVCEPKGAAGFRPPQAVNLSLETPFTAAIGDLNGDGRADLVWNHLGPTNEVQVGFGGLDAGFTVKPVVTLAGGPLSWVGFTLVVADVNGDGRDDLVWNDVNAGASATWIALSRGDGTFDPLTVTTRGEAVFANALAVSAAHVKAKPRPAAWDLLWSGASGADQVLAATLFGGPSPLDLAPQTLAVPAGGWTGYLGSLIGDVDGNAADDVVFGGGNKVVAAMNDGSGVFALKPVNTQAMTCGEGECPLAEGYGIGDVNGDGKADLVRWKKSFWSIHHCDWDMGFLGCWLWDDHSNGTTQVLLADATAASGFRALIGDRGWPVMSVDPDLVDVSGDGRADLVWVERGSTLVVRTATAQTDTAGAFTGFESRADHVPSPATPPGGAGSWVGYQRLYGDVNGDGVTDVVFTNNTATGYVVVDVRQAY